MIFRRKKRMVDIRELQKRGVVRIPKQETIVPTNQDGFVELGTNSKPVSSTESSNSNFFNFMGNSSSASSTMGASDMESDGYNKREVDMKVTELDNKIYKLEQRIELLERKLEINQKDDSGVGAMGW